MTHVKQFTSENFLMSTGGHLLLNAIMLTPFVIVVDLDTLVAPARVQIPEIDLAIVKITLA